MQPPPVHVAVEPSVLYFGTPVSLISTRNPDGSANLAPMSSSWYLGRIAVLGVAEGGQTLPNLRRERNCVINLPSASQHDIVEALAPLTGRQPVPAYKRERFRYEPRKFAAAGLSELDSDLVSAPRVAECPVHLEAAVMAIHAASDESFAIVETQVLRVHIAEELAVPHSHHVDTARWRPLFYVFRHYFGAGKDLGRNFRAEY